MCALRVVPVAETRKLYKLREEILAGLENNLSLVAELLGVRCVCQSCLCAHQGLQSHSGTGPGSLHCPSRPLVVTSLPAGP